jgi:hypothetical protein
VKKGRKWEFLRLFLKLESNKIANMRKLWIGALIATPALIAAFLLYENNYQVPRLDQAPQGKVLSAMSADCVQIRSLYQDRLVVLKANPDFSTLKVGEEKLALEDLNRRLTDILLTRMDPTIYIVDNSQEDGGASWMLREKLRQVLIVKNICIVDPKHPPDWYPLKPRLISCGAGDIRRFRTCRSIRQ